MNNTHNPMSKCQSDECDNLAEFVICDDCTDAQMYNYELLREGN